MLTKLFERYNWLPYVLPMAVFMILTQLEGSFKEAYPAIYIAKVIVVSWLVWVAKKPLSEVKVDKKWLGWSVFWGLLLLGMWILIEERVSYGRVGERSGFNPFTEMENPALAWVFISFRMIGLAIMVPIMEEIFWRSFALRYATDKEFDKIPVGTFSWGAFAIVNAVFGFSHPEWLPAVLYSAFMGLYLNWTKNLWACIVVHLVTNLGLGIYILSFGAWKYW